MRRTLFLLCLIAGLTAACSPAPAPPAAPDTAADIAAIGQVRSDYMAAFNSGDWAKFESLHTEDAAEYPMMQPTRQGRAAIIAAANEMAKEGKHEITITPADTLVGGDLAADTGTYRMVMTPAAGGAPMTIDGRYMVLLRRQADGWKLTRLIDNMSGPMPGMNMPMGGMPMGGMPMGGMPMGGAPPAPAAPPAGR